jgi:Mg2+-importing ATPase
MKTTWLSWLIGLIPVRDSHGAGYEARQITAHWSREGPDALADLRSGTEGLTDEEAARRLELYGPNSVEEERGTAALRLFVAQFSSPLVLILVFGAAVSMFLQDWIDAAIILAIVLGSALLGFTQEYRASAAVTTLRGRLALEALVVRGAIEKSVPARTVVPGDVVVLSAGHLVPGDGLVLSATDFLVSEAGLTGESFPVEKRPAVLPAETPLARRTNCVFLGTSVRSGRATVVIVKTGRATEFGAIAAEIAARPPETDFARGIRHFGQLLLRTMIVMVLFVVAANQLLGRPPLESMLFAVALAVGLTPELLPAIVSVTLSRGAREMAERGVIVRRLEAIENLGSIDVLCTDKTGTLTEGAITLHGAFDCQGSRSHEVQRLAFLNAALETGITNPLDAAIVDAGTRDGLTATSVKKIDEIPYDFSRKRLTIVVQDNNDETEHVVITKGAVASVLAVCTIDAHVREQSERYYEAMSQQGFRVLAVAVRRVAPKARYGHEDEEAMTFAGFLLFLDPPKTGVTETLRDLGLLGIQTKVITGDNRHIAAHLAGAIGLDPKAMLTGERLSRMKDEALWSLAPRTDLFVEVDPQQKERIVRALQRTGHVVGYLGDGINDAPALHAADAGISVDTAVDVARESADIVLLHRDLDVLRRGVEDGRATFANTLKYIAITTSANFGNMVSMAIATPILPFLPLAAKQILLNNFISDLPSIAISTDRVDPDQLEQPQRWDLGAIRRFMIVFGLLSTVFDLVAFAVLLHGFDADERTFQTAWFVMSLLTELAVVLVLRTRGSAWRSAPSALLLWTTIAAALAALGAPYAGAFSSLFDFVPLPGHLMAAALSIVVAYVAATEIVKRYFFRRLAGARVDGRHIT